MDDDNIISMAERAGDSKLWSVEDALKRAVEVQEENPADKVSILFVRADGEGSHVETIQSGENTVEHVGIVTMHLIGMVDIVRSRI